MAKVDFDSMLGAGDSKEVAVIQPEQAYSPKLYQFGPAIEYDQEDIKPPYLKLCQGNTQEVQDGLSRPGQFFAEGYDAQKEVTLIPLGLAKTRRYATGEGDDWQTHCSSGDAKYGSGNPGGSCAACPLSRPQPNPKSPDRKHIPCTLVYNFAAYSPELNTVVEVRFSRTATQTALTLIQHCVSKGMGNFAVRLTSKQNKGSGFTYFTPVVQPVPAQQAWLDKAAMLTPGGNAEVSDPEAV